jgi:hypothetical protein
MRLIKRSEFGWGASGASAARPTRGLVIHYDGSKQGLAGKPHTACIAYWKNTRAFHVGANRGWADIGYSFGACPHGEVFEGRGLNRMQAAQPGGNDTWYSCTLMGGPGEKPTAAQINAVRELRAWLMSKGVAGAVKGHRDFYSTSCPGDLLYAMVRDGTFTKGSTSTSNEEDDVAAKDLWQHELKVPFGSPENPEWQAGNVLVNIAKWVHEMRARQAEMDAKLAANTATIKALAETLAAGGPVDAEALIARIRAEIESVTVRLDVGGE